MWAKRKRSAPDAQMKELEEEIRQTRADLALAYRQFDQAIDPDLVASCIYQIEAMKARYNFLLRAIKVHRLPQSVAAVGVGGKKKWI